MEAQKLLKAECQKNTDGLYQFLKERYGDLCNRRYGRLMEILNLAYWWGEQQEQLLVYCDLFYGLPSNGGRDGMLPCALLPRNVVEKLNGNNIKIADDWHFSEYSQYYI
jgi:hypothetical protein